MTSQYLVPAVKRAFEIVEYLAQLQSGATISEIHREFRLPLSSAANILYTLRRLGYLERDDGSARYRLAGKLFSISKAALDNNARLGLCHPILEELVRESGLTGHLAVLRESDAVYVDRVPGRGFVQFSSYIGMRWPAYSSATGKALLAFLPEDRMTQALAQMTFKKVTAATITSKVKFRRQLAEFRQLGFTWEENEGEEGIACVAAPLFGHDDDVVAALSVTGTTTQISQRKLNTLGALVKQYAQKMTIVLRGR